MRLFLYLGFFLLSFKCLADDKPYFYKVKYDSLGYKIEVTFACEEGNVDCDEVYYKGVSKKNGSEIYLRGRTLNDFYSHRFLGYIFKNNSYSYMIREDVLYISKNDKILQKIQLHEINE